MGKCIKKELEDIGTFRIRLKIEFCLDLFETFVILSLSFRQNLIFITSFDKFGFSYSFGNNKLSLYQNSNIVGSNSLIDNLYLLDVINSNKENFHINYSDPKRKVNENSTILWHKHLHHISK